MLYSLLRRLDEVFIVVVICSSVVLEIGMKIDGCVHPKSTELCAVYTPCLSKSKF